MFAIILLASIVIPGMMGKGATAPKLPVVPPKEALPKIDLSPPRPPGEEAVPGLKPRIDVKPDAPVAADP